MKITFTKEAIDSLTPKVNATNGGVLQLKYDTEGCGCVVNGVAMLCISPNAEEDYLKVDTNYEPIFLPKEAIVFWDEEMTIHYLETYNCYQLKSNVQIINPRMSLINECRTA